MQRMGQGLNLEREKLRILLQRTREKTTTTMTSQMSPVTKKPIIETMPFKTLQSQTKSWSHLSSLRVIEPSSKTYNWRRPLKPNPNRRQHPTSLSWWWHSWEIWKTRWVAFKMRSLALRIKLTNWTSKTLNSTKKTVSTNRSFTTCNSGRRSTRMKFVSWKQLAPSCGHRTFPVILWANRSTSISCLKWVKRIAAPSTRIRARSSGWPLLHSRMRIECWPSRTRSRSFQTIRTSQTARRKTNLSIQSTRPPKSITAILRTVVSMIILTILTICRE